MWHRSRLLGILLLTLAMLAGCSQTGQVSAGHLQDGIPLADEGGPEATNRTDVVFSRDILPILQSEFAPLLDKETGLSLDSWSSLIAGSDFGEVVIPFDADRSLLIQLAEQAGENGPSSEDIDLVRNWIDAGARNDDGEVPYAGADQLLYVCNQGSAVISVIDMEANLVIRTIDLRDFGFSENAKPHHAAVSPDGAFWYVSLIGENTVLKFTRDYELVGRASFEVPGMLALSPSTEELYVGRSMSAVNPPMSLGMVDLSEMKTLEELDVFFPRPHAIETSPDGSHLYTASLGINQIASIDTKTLKVEITDVPGPHHSFVQFIISPDGNTLLTGGEMSGQLLFLDVTDPMQPSVRKTLDLGGAPWHPVFSPDGRFLYVPRKMANAVSVIDMESETEVAEITGEGLAEPHGSAIRADGRYLYVSGNNLRGTYTPRYDLGSDPPGTIAVIDTESREIVKVLEVENYPTGIGTRPAG